MKKRGLGRGIQNFVKDQKTVDAIINDSNPSESLVEVNIEEIHPNPNQARKNFSQEELEDLRDSIMQFGVISPIILKRDEEGYLIIAGERRFRAAKLAGLKTIPSIIKDIPKEEADKISLIENIQRVDLDPLEEARGFSDVINTYGLSHEELATAIGKSRSHITNSLRLLKLDSRVQDMLEEELISVGHALLLLNVKDPNQQYKNAMRIVKAGTTVTEVRELYKANKKLDKDLYLENIKEELISYLGTKCKVSKTGNRRTIQIDCFGEDELNRVCDLILGGEEN